MGMSHVRIEKPRPRAGLFLFGRLFYRVREHTGGMARLGNNLRIALPEREALPLLLRVKPTAAMPRPGAHPTKAKKSVAKGASAPWGKK